MTTTNKLTTDEQFFYDHAGYGYNPATETAEQGRENTARGLARAELYAREHDWQLIGGTSRSREAKPESRV